MADEVRPKALMIPLDKIPLLELLEPEQFKRVVVSMSVYIADGTTPEGFEPIEKMAFESLRPFMDENIKTYQRTIEANRQNGRKGGRPKKPTETDGFSEKPTETDGVPKETHENQSTKYKVQSTKTTDTNVSIIEANASAPKKFVPPSVDECTAYFREKGCPLVEGEKFFDYFNSNGWKVSGKAAMKNWQSAANNWMRRYEETHPQKRGESSLNGQFAGI